MLWIGLAAANEAAIVDFATGTGFVVSPEGHILTNVHVEAREIAWVSIGGKAHRIELIALDQDLDLALYQSRRAGEDWIAIRQEPPQRSEEVTLLGHPREALTVTDGRIRSKPEVLGPVPIVEHDAPTWWGSSGSPLLDEDGQAIGLHWAWSTTRGTLLAIDLPAAARTWEPLGATQSWSAQ